MPENFKAYQTFEEVLKTKERIYSEIAPQMGRRPGKRLVTFTADFLDAVFIEAGESGIESAAKRFLKYMFQRLPKDAAIYNPDGQYVRLMPTTNTYGEGTFYLTYCILVVSAEWEPEEEGGFISRIGPLHNLPIINEEA